MCTLLTRATSYSYVKTEEESVAKAMVDGGTDINSGAVYYDHVLDALKDGLITKANVETALRRTLKLRFKLGLFDPVEGRPVLPLNI